MMKMIPSSWWLAVLATMLIPSRFASMASEILASVVSQAIAVVRPALQRAVFSIIKKKSATLTTRLFTVSAIMTIIIVGVAGEQFIVINVTMTGVKLNETFESIPRNWSTTLSSEATEVVAGNCPAGRYCPSGSDLPKMCPLGTYSPVENLTEPCKYVCWSNYYCPDPGVKLPCPAHTTSKHSSVSQLDCKCNAGYTCTYRKQINLNLLLNIPLSVWLSDSGKKMKEALIKAVAESAGVSAANVQVNQVLPHLGSGGGNRRLLTTADQVQPGGSTERRLLSANTARARKLLGGEHTLIRLTLQGAEALGEDVLQAKLGALPEFRGGRSWIAPPKVHWTRADRMQVKPAASFLSLPGLF